MVPILKGILVTNLNNPKTWKAPVTVDRYHIVKMIEQLVVMISSLKQLDLRLCKPGTSKSIWEVPMECINTNAMVEIEFKVVESL